MKKIVKFQDALMIHIAISLSTYLEGDLHIPRDAVGLVLFAHGSGSSRHSPRNRFVAAALNRGGLATLLLDLLTPEEERIDEPTGHLRFDIGFLTERLSLAAHWALSNKETKHLSLGFFGASTGAAAALCAAAKMGKSVKAVVSRGGRPDLAGSVLSQISTPTLLIVGGSDHPVISMNQEALARLQGVKEMVIVPGATHLFEEPGALEEVARLALEWFRTHLI
ncbi:MAG TPA: dienelactone hydrolase family protein [Rhabdochlamydiaceae bacterium]